jgi:hypothetical protein
MHSRCDNNLPNSRNENRGNSSKIDNGIKGRGGVFSFVFILLNKSISFTGQEMLAATPSNSCHLVIREFEKILLKVNFRSLPSQSWLTVLPCSLERIYKSKYWTDKGDVPN